MKKKLAHIPRWHKSSLSENKFVFKWRSLIAHSLLQINIVRYISFSKWHYSSNKCPNILRQLLILMRFIFWVDGDCVLAAWWRSAHCSGSEEPGEGGGSRGRAAAPQTHNPHFQRRATLSPPSNVFCRARVTKQAKQDSSRSSGSDHQIVSWTWFGLYSLGGHLTEIAHRI